MPEHTTHDEPRHEAETSRAAEQTRQVAEQAQESIASTAAEQKHAIADDIAVIAEALQTAADELSGRDRPSMAGYVRTGADRIQRLADSLRERELGDLLRQVEDYGRRQPVTLLGAAAAAGFLLSRMARASTGDGGERMSAPDTGEAEVEAEFETELITSPHEPPPTTEPELVIPAVPIGPEEER